MMNAFCSYDECILYRILIIVTCDLQVFVSNWKLCFFVFFWPIQMFVCTRVYSEFYMIVWLAFI